MKITFETTDLNEAKKILVALGMTEPEPMDVITTPPTTTEPEDTEEETPCDGSGVDADGLPWDERIHASTKTKVQNGTWKRKRGVTPAYYNTIAAGLKVAEPVDVPAPPTDPTPADVPAPPAAPALEPVPAPPAEQRKVTEFEEFNSDLIKWLSDTSLSLDDRKARAVEFANTLKTNGFKSKQELEGNDDTIILIRSLLGF